MRTLYSKVVRVGLLWMVLLGAMAALTGTSAAVVLAENRAIPAFVCTGTCNQDKPCKFPLACFCDIDNTCQPITP